MDERRRDRPEESPESPILSGGFRLRFRAAIPMAENARPRIRIRCSTLAQRENALANNRA